jgi:uncharacterized membrane protein
MNEAATMHIGNQRREDRSIAIQRWGAVLGGSALAIYGLSKRSPLGIAMAATGGTVIYLGAKPNTLRRKAHARSTVLLNCSPAEAYQFWHDLENLPRFMNHIESVTKTGDRRSHWVALGPFGTRVNWEAQIDEDRANEHISWHSLPESDVQVVGSVSFRPAPANRGTIVEAAMEFRSSAGALGSAAAKFLGKHPGFLMRQDLRRLKALIETGEIPTTDGQSHGPRSAITGFARMANPDRPIQRGAHMKDIFEAQRRIS